MGLREAKVPISKLVRTDLEQVSKGGDGGRAPPSGVATELLWRNLFECQRSINALALVVRAGDVESYHAD